ncbi:hypothetical protein J2W32_004445 [Variovorax boronicumulans]|uniref:Uncharacterized protein n=1 Tax=Variovorax boronicumulans TaxID=436515 RepID=A0AAW8D5R4_9BURK|nr:hypothetical protein [Variovorax boronicumulans]MDQ0055387.1 hypothetical protein [Variovorax boronicumulans]
MNPITYAAHFAYHLLRRRSLPAALIEMAREQRAWSKK